MNKKEKLYKEFVKKVKKLCDEYGIIITGDCHGEGIGAAVAIVEKEDLETQDWWQWHKKSIDWKLEKYGNGFYFNSSD